MLITTTPILENRKIEAYLGLVGGDAIVGVDLDYETVGDKMLMVSATGTAVRLA
jgi:uncharacterized protein YbjQ (UPF0145 family)